MNSSTASKWVLLSGVVTVGSVSAGYMLPEHLGGRGELVPPTVLIANGLVFTGLSVVANFAPSIAAGMAALVALNALRIYILKDKDAKGKPQGPIERFFTP